MRCTAHRCFALLHALSPHPGEASFAVQEVFSWMQSRVAVSAFGAAFWGHFPKITAQTVRKAFSYDSFYWFYGFRSYVYIFNLFRSDSYMV